MSTPRPILLLALAALLGGCAAKQDKQLLDQKRANTRALEQRRMRVMMENEDQGLSARGAEITILDPEKTFDPSVAQFGNQRQAGGKAARTTVFNYEDRVRTKQFGTKDATTKGAWQGDVKFETKAATVRESWFSRMKARTKNYETRESAMAEKSAPVRQVGGVDKPFLVPGRRQALFDREGPAAQAMGGDRYSGDASWSGNLNPMTIDDVKKLLNKN